jgi:hypothetical protein
MDGSESRTFKRFARGNGDARALSWKCTLAQILQNAESAIHVLRIGNSPVCCLRTYPVDVNVICGCPQNHQFRVPLLQNADILEQV